MHIIEVLGRIFLSAIFLINGVGKKSKKSIYSMKKSSFESGRIFSKKYIESFIKAESKKLRK